MTANERTKAIRAYNNAKLHYTKLISQIQARNDVLKQQGLSKAMRNTDTILVDLKKQQATLTIELPVLKATAACARQEDAEQQVRDKQRRVAARRKQLAALEAAQDPDDVWIFGQDAKLFRDVRGFDRHVVRKLCKAMGQDVFLAVLAECREDAKKAWDAEQDARTDFEAMLRRNSNQYAGINL